MQHQLAHIWDLGNYRVQAQIIIKAHQIRQLGHMNVRDLEARSQPWMMQSLFSGPVLQVDTGQNIQWQTFRYQTIRWRAIRRQAIRRQTILWETFRRQSIVTATDFINIYKGLPINDVTHVF